MDINYIEEDASGLGCSEIRCHKVLSNGGSQVVTFGSLNRAGKLICLITILFPKFLLKVNSISIGHTVTRLINLHAHD